MKSGNLNFLEPSGPLQTCNGTDLLLPYTCWRRSGTSQREARFWKGAVNTYSRVILMDVMPRVRSALEITVRWTFGFHQQVTNIVIIFSWKKNTQQNRILLPRVPNSWPRVRPALVPVSVLSHEKNISSSKTGGWGGGEEKTFGQEAMTGQWLFLGKKLLSS